MSTELTTEEFTTVFDIVNSTTNAETSSLPLTTQIIDIEKSCSEYYANSSGFIIKDYEGIPENLIINLIAWLALIVVFTFIRRIGDYGRFGLIKNDEEKKLLSSQTIRYDQYSTNIFQNGDDAQSTHSIETENALDSSELSEQSNPDRSDSFTEHILASQRSVVSLTKEPGPHSEKYQEKYFFSWLIHMWTLKDDHIKEKSGKDAMYYLIFQRYLIVYLLIITCATIAILLPINILNSYVDSSDNLFSKTTITNINPKSSVLWVHLILSWVFLILGCVMLKVFSKKMNYDEGEYVSRTVLITNFSIENCEIDLVKQHFSEAYPELTITDIQFAYDIRKLGKLAEEKRSMECGRIQSQKIFDQTNQRPLMHPFHLGSIFELCCCCCDRCLKDKNKKTTDAIEFYTKKESDLTVKIAEYKEKVLKNPLGVLFITFLEQDMAARFLKDYHLGIFGGCLRSQFNDKGYCLDCYICKNLAKNSSLSFMLKSDMWSVKYATSPSNIIWENVAKYGIAWWFRVLLINIVLFIVMIFFTTPAILIEKIESFSYITTEISKIFPEYLQEFLPSLILRLLAALLPVLVAWTALAELHWTRSSRNRSMMVKTYLTLLFMVLILPTLGLTSINALFQWFNDDRNIKWRCVSDNGAFFIKYVTTFGLIGTALDLLRLPDLLLYLLKMIWARSAIERHDVRQQAALEFNYGVEYAWILSMFTVTLSFSVVCPLITPFGLLYMVLKHLTDRYNLYFGYIPTKVDKRIHKTAVTFAFGSFIMLQFCILFFIAVRNKGNINSNSMTTVQTFIIIVSCILFTGRLFFGFFKRLSPFHKHSGSSCQISRDLDRPNNELDTQESYTKLEQDTEQDDIQTEQPGSATNPTKKRRKNIFKSKRHRKKYEMFQSPFLPSLLRNKSSDYVNMNNSNPSRVQNMSINSNQSNVIDLAVLIADNKDNINELTRPGSAANTLNESQIDLQLDSSLDSTIINQPKTSNSTEFISKNTQNKDTGQRNVAFQEEGQTLEA